MQSYFDQWHFKHPQPQDLRQALEAKSGLNLSWLFDDIIPTTKQIDFKIKKVKQDENGTTVTIKNKGKVDSPAKIDVYSLGQYRKSMWIEPGQKTATIQFPERSIDEVRIDGFKNMPEVNRNNNNWHKKGLFGKLEPINFEFLAGDNEADKTTIWFSPMVGYNRYDQAMIGMAFHNYTLPRNKIEYLVVPLFSFGRKNISGEAGVRYSITPARNFKSITIGAKAKTFGFAVRDGKSAFLALSPYINMAIGKPLKRKNYKQNLKVQGSYVNENSNVSKIIVGGFIQYNFSFKKRIHKVKFQLRGDLIQEANENIAVMNAHLNASYSLSYWDEKNKDIIFSTYFGKNVLRNGTPQGRYGLALGGQSGTQDVFYENYMIARNATTSPGSQKRNFNHGNFNTVSDLTFGNHLFTANVFLELPYIPLIGVFADYGIVNYNTGLNQYMQSGIGIRLLDGNIGLYMPLIENDNLNNSYLPHVNNVWKKVRFTFNFAELTPEKLINNSL